MSVISDVRAFEMLDSRGNPTVMAEVELSSGVMSSAMAPSGASTGSREALELRDHDKDRYMGKGVLKAVANINNVIKSTIVGINPKAQLDIDNMMIELDGSKDKSALGANAILSVSLAVAKAASLEKGVPLYSHISDLNGTPGKFNMPIPMMNILNGGEHANNNIDIQEFMVQPIKAGSFARALQTGVEIFHALKRVLISAGLNTAVGDEGGFAPDLDSNSSALSIISEAVAEAGYRLGTDVTLALDCAASEFYRSGFYKLKGEGKKFSPRGFTDFLGELCRQFPITSIEDGQDESDWSGWRYHTDQLGKKVQLVGDDLFVTNTEILRRGIDQGIGNSILIKFNQIGTLSETLNAISMAKEAGYGVIISHRSGETEDTTIADLAVGTAAGQIKTGSLCRSDRVAKYNRLLRIEAELGCVNAPYYGGLGSGS